MRIKRFVAPDMRSALQMVREEQGPNAVILSNRRIEGGVEVVAATDYDEALVQQALRSTMQPASQVLRAVESTPAPTMAAAPLQSSALRARPSAPAETVAVAAPAMMTTPVFVSTPTPTPTPTLASQEASPVAATATIAMPNTPSPQTQTPVVEPTTVSVQASPVAVAVDVTTISAPTAVISPVVTPVPAHATFADKGPGLENIRKEITGMRELIEREVGRFADERLRGAPVRAAALDELLGYGVEPELARHLVGQIPLDVALPKARGIMLAQLSKSLCVDSHEPIDDHGAIALVGPTGVGKTTTLAKLAARYAAKYSSRDVALVTTDIHRPGAKEQLFTFGRMLGMPVIEASGESSLSSILDRLSEYKLILIDTTGLGPRDKALSAQLAWLRAAQRIRSYLVLPANAQTADLEEVIQRFKPVAPVGVILSKLDETGHLGGALSLAVRHRFPLSYVTDGQRVPEDIHPVVAHRLVLRLGELQKAAKRQPSGEENSNAVA